MSAELCRALAPLSIEAALKAEQTRRAHDSSALENARLRLQAARYQAERAFEQYDLVDPRNRLVADNLEQRLNAKLAEVNDAELRVKELAKQTNPMAPEQQRQLRQLAEDLPTVWSHPKADPVLKKRILRTAIHEVLVVHQVDQQSLAVTIHWQGGAHTRCDVKKRATPVGRKADPGLVELVRELAREIAGAEMARILNMKKLKTPHGHRWTLERVRHFRRQHQVLLGEAATGARDYLTANEAADYLGISRNGLLGLERLGALSRNQITDFAPWRLTKKELDSPAVQSLVGHLKHFGRLPQGGCPEQQEKLFP